MITLTRSRHLTSAVLALGSILACVGIVLLALEGATGATLLPGSTTTYETEYLDMGTYAVTGLVAVALTIAAWSSVWPAVVGTLGVFVVEWWAITESNSRLAEDGWSDGLEVLAYVLPVGTVLVTLLLVGIAATAGRARRRHRLVAVDHD